MITLPDGRRLAWHEYGDPAGFPVIYTSGIPESGLAGACFDAAAREAGLRWVSPDKPGYGGSDYQRSRSLLDWADDVAALAGQLGLDRFALAGESGGAPCTLAAGYKLADRVPVVVLIAAMGPAAPAELAGMKPSVRAMLWLARHAPALNRVPCALLALLLRSPRRRARFASREPGDAVNARQRLDAAADAFRHGTRATAQELALVVRRWGFPLAGIEVPVHLWHGVWDRNVPVAVAERLGRDLPAATVHLSTSSGHDVARDRLDEIMTAIAVAAKES